MFLRLRSVAAERRCGGARGRRPVVVVFFSGPRHPISRGLDPLDYRLRAGTSSRCPHECCQAADDRRRHRRARAVLVPAHVSGARIKLPAASWPPGAATDTRVPKFEKLERASFASVLATDIACAQLAGVTVASTPWLPAGTTTTTPLFQA